MKILFIVNEFPALSETFILGQMTGLIDRGHEIDIYAARPRKENAIHSDVIKYRLLERTYYYDAATTGGNRDISASPGGGTRRIFRSLSIYGRILLTHFKHYRPGGYSSLSRLFREVHCLPWNSSYDIIHCHFGPNGERGLMLRDIGAIRGKLVTAFHGFDISLYLRQEGVDVYKRLFDAGDLFLPVSEYWKRRLIEIGCPEEKIVVHKMGVDCTKFRYSPRSIGSDGQIRLVSIARLVEKKGLEYGIRAVARLMTDYKNIQYTIIGDGPLKESLQKIIVESGFGDRIELIGWREQEEIIGFFEKAHILLAPSVTSVSGDQEGIPVALIEANAMGLPVISTRHSGIPELVRDGASGFLVPEKDENAIYDRLKYLVDHPGLWPDIGSNGRKTVEANHDIVKLNDNLSDMFLRIMRPGRR